MQGVSIKAERDKYRRVWRMPVYRQKCHSLALWQHHRYLFPPTFASAIDLGCGLGRLIPVWLAAQIDAYGVDLAADVSLDPDVPRDRVFVSALEDFDPPMVFDVGVCADVMEHIPEERVDQVLRRIASCCRWVLFKIANFNSQSLGMQLHLTQRDAAWWQRHLVHAMGPRVERIPYDSGRPDYLLLWEAPCA